MGVCDVLIMELKHFNCLVRKAEHLHSGTTLSNYTCANDTAVSTDEVFGRICNTEGSLPPLSLSDTPARKIVFVFGSDSIDSIILRHNTYECLRHLGFDYEYICYEVSLI